MRVASQTILERVAGADKSAINDCLNKYGDFVWCVVKNYVHSDKEAEVMVQEVFKDIWQYAQCFNSSKLSENDFISLLIRHRLRQTH